MNNIKPNFSKAYSKANEILVKSNVISAFLFSTTNLVKELSKKKCKTYKKALDYGIDISIFGSESATIFEFKNRYIIFYDDSKPKTHINYSILHELGHFLLGHIFNISDKELYSKYEIESNFFVAQLLMPEQVLRELMKRGIKITKEFLMEHFSVSEIAAKKRIDTLSRTNLEWRSGQEKEFDDIILFKFKNFIDNICPINSNSFDFEYEYYRQNERNNWL